MVHGSENPQIDALAHRAPSVSYHLTDAAALLARPGTLAVFDFDGGTPASDDPRYLRVTLDNLDDTGALELWQVDAAVTRGRAGALQWSAGGGWLFAAVELDERDYDNVEACAASAYAILRDFVGQRSERHVLRIWNYLGEINLGSGDAERYKHFCDGRARGMGAFFAEGFPAATAIGHLGPSWRMQIYLLACDQPGRRVENPRQVSAWRYPRQYGRTPPSFARGMTLPAHDALAISGTAAVVGHASAHRDDLDAQLRETLTNLDVLLDSAGMRSGFDERSPLKVYVRHADDTAHVRDFLHARLPGVPLLLVHGDICRRELLVEIDGWRYA